MDSVGPYGLDSYLDSRLVLHAEKREFENRSRMYRLLELRVVLGDVEGPSLTRICRKFYSSRNAMSTSKSLRKSYSCRINLIVDLLCPKEDDFRAVFEKDRTQHVLKPQTRLILGKSLNSSIHISFSVKFCTCSKLLSQYHPLPQLSLK